MSRRRPVATLATLLVAAALGACGGDDEGGGEPSVSFVSPKEGSTVPRQFTARVKFENFETDTENFEHANVDGKGHLHFSLDGGKLDRFRHSGRSADLAARFGGKGKYSITFGPTISYRIVPPGRHKLHVELASNDHSPTGASAEVSFTVR